MGLCRGNKSSFTLPKFLIRKYNRDVRSVLMGQRRAARSVKRKPPLFYTGLSAPPVLTGHTHLHTSSIVPLAIFGHFSFWSSVCCVPALVRFKCAFSLSLSLSLPVCVDKIPHALPLFELRCFSPHSSKWINMGGRFYTPSHILNKLLLKCVGNDACVCVCEWTMDGNAYMCMWTCTPWLSPFKVCGHIT